MYDPAIERFPSVDRFAEKYSFQSPYVYAGNNPISFIDVNGDSILIIHKKERVIYNDGKLTNVRTGKEYQGKRNKKGKLKGFIGKTARALDKIRKGGDAGNNLISTLQNDSDFFAIREGDNSTVGRRVSFDPYSKNSGLDENGNTERPSFIGLAHELSHALDWDDGSIDDGTWLDYSSGETSTNSEKYASHIENQIRAENNIPLRAYYGIDNGKGVGRLLIPGTRKSPHYNNCYLLCGGAKLKTPFVYKE